MDYTAIGIVLAVMIYLNLYARSLANDQGWLVYNIGSGMLGLYTMAWIVSNGFFTLLFNTTNSTLVNEDPNVMTVVMAIMTIMSLLPIYTRNR